MISLLQEKNLECMLSQPIQKVVQKCNLSEDFMILVAYLFSFFGVGYLPILTLLGSCISVL